MGTMIRVIFLLNFLLLFVSTVFSQQIEVLHDRLDALKIVRVNLSDSLDSIDLKIDSLQQVINEINFNELAEGSKKIYLKPGIRIYEGPHVLRPVLAELPDGGSAIFIEEDQSSYIKINYGGVEGYVPTWSIEDESQRVLREQEQVLREKRETERIAEQRRVHQLRDSVESNKMWISSFNANVRNGPSTETEITTQFEQGKEVFSQETTGEWVRIKYLESKYDRRNIKTTEDIENVYKEGWVHKSLVSDEAVEPLSNFERNRIIEEREKNQRRSKFINDHPNISSKHKQQIREGVISIGMTEAMVRASWGDPNDINRTLRANYTREQWIYGYSDRKYIYIENGILTTIQD